jgi:hypothetical protein
MKTEEEVFGRSVQSQKGKCQNRNEGWIGRKTGYSISNRSEIDAGMPD